MKLSRRRLLGHGAGAVMIGCGAGALAAAPAQADHADPVDPSATAATTTPQVMGSASSSADPQAGLAARLRGGGVVLAFRHALAPGTFDPPGFALEDCRTQRNLNDEGRAQAARIGQWFREQGLVPARVRSSPWCRCLETARVAFGTEAVETWTALGSPRGTSEQAYPEYQTMLRKAAAQRRATAGFEVWVTHMFVLQDLVGQGVGSAEALMLRGDPRAPEGRSALQVLGHWRLPSP